MALLAIVLFVRIGFLEHHVFWSVPAAYSDVGFRLTGRSVVFAFDKHAYDVFGVLALAIFGTTIVSYFGNLRSRFAIAADCHQPKLLLPVAAGIVGGIAGAFSFWAAQRSWLPGGLFGLIGAVIVAFAMQALLGRTAERLRASAGHSGGSVQGLRTLALAADFGAMFVVAAALIVPLLAALLVPIAIWLLVGSRRRSNTKYAGLRILR